MLPRLDDHACRLRQDRAEAEGGLGLHRKVGFDPETLGAETMPILDAAFGIEAIAAHIPFPGGAGRARNGIGPAHDPDNVIAAAESAFGRRLFDSPERFMPEDQALFA